MSSSTRRWLTLIVVIAAVLRFVPIWFGLPYPQARPDEEVALGKAVDVLHGHLNPQFFHWPSLTFYVLAGVLGAAAGVRELLGADGEAQFAERALIARGLIALAGTTTVVILFRLSQRIAGDVVALLAAAFLAVAVLHVRESHFAMTDVLMTMLLWTSLALILRGVEAGEPRAAIRWCAAAGLAGGLATSTKYSAAAVVVAMAAAQALWWMARPSLVLSWRTWLPSLAFGATMAAGFLIGTPYALFDAGTFVRDLLFDFTHLSEGHTGGSLGRGWIYHATRSLPYGVGWAATAAALVGIVPLVRDHARAAFVLGTFAVAFYAAIGSGYTVFFRYVLPLVPFICLLAGVGVFHAAAWVTHRSGTSRRVALLGLAFVSLVPGLVYSAWFDLLLARTDTRVLAGEYLAPRLQPQDTLHDAGGNYSELDLSRVQYHEWEYDPRAGSFGAPDGGTPHWLVLMDSPVAGYASTPLRLRQLAQERYALVYTVRATRGSGRRGVYDLQDAFFMPIAGFRTVLRPGPNISIYRRRDLPPVSEHP